MTSSTSTEGSERKHYERVPASGYTPPVPYSVMPSTKDSGVNYGLGTPGIFPPTNYSNMFGGPLNFMFFQNSGSRSYSRPPSRGNASSGRTRKRQKTGSQSQSHIEEDSGEARRLEKNEREKQRRNDLNTEFKKLADLLDLPRRGCTEKVTILRQAVEKLQSYKALENERDRRPMAAQEKNIKESLKQF